MLTFFITAEERRRAQDRAAELDISKSNPPGKYPYVWDNRQNSVKRWYDYGSSEDKLGTIYFQPVADDGQLPPHVKCTTEITYHPFQSQRHPLPVSITAPHEHEELIGFFIHELLDTLPSASRSTRTYPQLYFNISQIFL